MFCIEAEKYIEVHYKVSVCMCFDSRGDSRMFCVRFPNATHAGVHWARFVAGLIATDIMKPVLLFEWSTWKMFDSQLSRHHATVN